MQMRMHPGRFARRVVLDESVGDRPGAVRHVPECCDRWGSRVRGQPVAECGNPGIHDGRYAALRTARESMMRVQP